MTWSSMSTAKDLDLWYVNLTKMQGYKTFKVIYYLHHMSSDYLYHILFKSSNLHGTKLKKEINDAEKFAYSY